MKNVDQVNNQNVASYMQLVYLVMAIYTAMHAACELSIFLIFCHVRKMANKNFPSCPLAKNRSRDSYHVRFYFLVFV